MVLPVSVLERFECYKVFRPVYLVNGVIKVLLLFYNSMKQIVYFIQLALIVIYLV